MALSLRRECEQSIDSTVCPNCRGQKDRGRSFCYRCFKSLPFGLQRALMSKTWSDGLVDSWDEAREHLKGV